MKTVLGCSTLLAYGLLAAAATPADAQLFHKWGATTPACNTCPAPILPATANPCAPQTVQYVPTTAYRAQCVNVPVTSYRPVCTTDPCTGCQRTAYSPITTYVQQTRYVPYTTYRLAYSNPCATTCASPCSTGACGTPMVSRSMFGSAAPVSMVAPAGCTSCGTGGVSYAAPTMPAPSLSPVMPSTSYVPSTTYQPTTTLQPTTTYQPSTTMQPTTTYVPSTTSPSPGTYLPPTTTQPSGSPALSQPVPQNNSPSTGSGGPSTFKSDAPASDAMKPIPDAGVYQQNNAPEAQPRLINPESRVTDRPLYPEGSYTALSWVKSATLTTISREAEAPAAPVDNVQWRASNR